MSKEKPSRPSSDISWPVDQEPSAFRNVSDLPVLSTLRALNRGEQEQAPLSEHIRLLLESTNEGIYGIDLEGRCTFANRAAGEMLGYRPEEMLGRNMHQLVHHHRADGSEYPESECPIYQAFRARKGCRVEDELFWRRDGSPIPVSYSTSPLLEGDECRGGVIVFTDVTQRRQAEEALRQSEERWRALTEGMPQLVWTSGANGQADFFSCRWQEYTGQPPQQALGLGWLAVLHPADVPPTAARWQEAIAASVNFEVKFRLLCTSEGQYRWHLARAWPQRDAGGKVIKWFGTCTDIDDQVRAEVGLKEADHRKNEFLAMLGHELRNPLAPVRNALALLKAHYPSDPALVQVGTMMERQVAHLTRLVDDLLDVSRITRGKVEMRLEQVDLATIIARAVEEVRPYLGERAHQLEVVLCREPLPLHADPARIQQVLANLLTNAGKYTEPSGWIRLTAQRVGDEAVVCVRDNGIGIRPEMLEQIFEMFTQADRVPGRLTEGLGLGLPLVRRLVELHGGQVTAVSAGLGQGSEFILRLPLTSPPSAPPLPQALAAPEKKVGQPLRVLVVDDNKDAAESCAMLLRLHGHEVEVAYDGRSALEKARLFLPEAVLLDIGLPRGMDGYEVARRLRQMPEARQALLIAMTGYGQDEDRRRGQEAGFDHHVTKPAEPDELQSLLRAFRPQAPG